MTAARPPGEVARRVRRRAKLAPEVLTAAIQDATAEAWPTVLADTPVDTGLMRRSWRFERRAWGVRVLNVRPRAKFVKGVRKGALRTIRLQITREKRAIAKRMKAGKQTRARKRVGGTS